MQNELCAEYSFTVGRSDVTDKSADLMAGSGLDVVSVAIVMSLRDDERVWAVCNPDEASLVDEGLCMGVRRGGVPTTALTAKGWQFAVEQGKAATSSSPGELALGIARVLGRQLRSCTPCSRPPQPRC